MPSMAPSLLEYARYHDLATDHLAFDLDLSAHLKTAENEPPYSSSFNAHPNPLPAEPKLRLRKSELNLLAASLRPPTLPSWDDILPDRHRIRDLKLETPLLLTDHEADLRRFTERPRLELKGIGIFPECDNVQSKRPNTKIAHEKFQATKEDLMYLKRILHDSYTSEGYQQLLRDVLPRCPRMSMIRSLDEDETELEEDKDLRDLEKQNPSVLPKGPSSAYIQSNTTPVFSATRSLLNFMGTRANKRPASTTSHHVAAVETGGGTL